MEPTLYKETGLDLSVTEPSGGATGWFHWTLTFHVSSSQVEGETTKI